MSFHSFLGTRGSFHYIFYQHHGYVVLYIPPLELLELIERWHFAVALCDANSDCGRDSKGHYSQSIHTCLLRLGGGGGGQNWLAGAMAFATWLFERWHFIGTIFTCGYGWVQTAHRSIVFCVYMRRQMSAPTRGGAFFYFVLRLYFIPPPRLSACSYFIFAVHAHAGKHSIWKEKKMYSLL